jgi:acyl carrier protein
MQMQLIDIWWEVLARKVGIDDNFFEWGGHSLKATLMVSKIHKKLNTRVPLAEVFKTPTIRGLTRFIKKINREQFPGIPLAEEKEYYALSSAQKRMYILSQLDIETTNYNIPGALLIEGNPDGNRLPGVFSELTRRHESLRTSFHLYEGEPVQVICKNPGFEVEYLESMGNNISEIITGFTRPFDLTRAPLLRVQSVRLAGDKHLLLCDMPHIISDAVSMEILTKEFIYLYNGKNLSPLRLQYKDFSQWQDREKESESMKKQEEYWLKQFPAEIPVLDLPTDFARKEVQNAAGHRIYFNLGADLNQGLKQLAANTNTTIYMILLAAFNVLLFKLTRQEDMVIGTPITGRRHVDLQHMIGMFVNMLPMRNQPIGSLGFGEFLEKVKQTAVAAYENQDYQFDQLAARLGLQGNAGRTPLFSVVFNMVSTDSSNGHTLSDERLSISPYPIDHNTVVFDLILTAIEVDEEIVNMSFNYAAALFREEKVRQMIDYYIHILDQVKETSQVRLADISISHGLLSIESYIDEDSCGDFVFQEKSK